MEFERCMEMSEEQFFKKTHQFHHDGRTLFSFAEYLRTNFKLRLSLLPVLQVPGGRDRIQRPAILLFVPNSNYF